MPTVTHRLVSTACVAFALLLACGGGEPSPAIDESALAQKSALAQCSSRAKYGESCDDGDPCTLGDRCSKGVCRGVAYSCDDANVCTDEACDGAGGCIQEPNEAPCNDGRACTATDVCTAGACVGTPGVESCTNGIDDDCDALVDLADADCAVSCSCTSPNPCMTAACDASGACIYSPNTATCDDRSACTVNDVCGGGVCAGTRLPDAPTVETDCFNLIDDDCDGLPDQADLECATGCTAPPEADCADGNDNDCDGRVDGLDPDCPPMDCYFDPCPSGWLCGAGGYCYEHCFNGVWDGGEGDVDCGGACDARCATGQHCWTHPDCVTGVCVNGVCQ